MSQKNTRARIVPLAITIYTEGTCFLCGKKLDTEYYVHFECAIAYTDHKEMKQKEMNRMTEEALDKKYNEGKSTDME